MAARDSATNTDWLRARIPAQMGASTVSRLLGPASGRHPLHAHLAPCFELNGKWAARSINDAPVLTQQLGPNAENRLIRLRLPRRDHRNPRLGVERPRSNSNDPATAGLTQ